MSDKAIWGGANLMKDCQHYAESLDLFAQEVEEMRRKTRIANLRVTTMRGRLAATGAPLETLEEIRPKVQACDQLSRISPDFQGTIEATCELCQNGIGECMVTAMIRAGRDDS